MVYPLCDRTVTVYRQEETGVKRQVLEGCYYHWHTQEHPSDVGLRQDTKFLLILPGDKFSLAIGDRIYDGIGPENVDWDSFLPVLVPGLSQVEYVKPWYLGGRLCHTEAGRK